MIKPTVGRVVWFYRDGISQFAAGSQPEAAIVAYVHSDEMLNLMVVNSAGLPESKTSVPLLQEEHFSSDDTRAWPSSFATWMPYQIGQAKRHSAEASSS